MKAKFFFVLILILSLSLLFGCSNTNQNSEPKDSEIYSDDGEEKPYSYAVDHSDFNGLEVTVMECSMVDVTRFEMIATEETSSQDRVCKAIYTRNCDVEEKLNINFMFKEVDGAKVQDVIKELFTAGDPEVDLVDGGTLRVLGTMTTGALADLTQIDELYTDRSYWNQSWIDSVQYKDSIYALVGDATPSYILKTIVTLVNIDQLQQWYPTNTPDLYSVVENGDWTLDYMLELAKDVYSDNGSIPEVADLNDTHGLLLGTISQPAQALLTSMRFTWSVLDSESERQIITLTDEHNVDIVQRIQAIYKDPPHGIFVSNEIPGVYYYADVFANGNLLMTTGPMFTAEKVANAGKEFDYIILPMPKYDKAQRSYYSSNQDSATILTVLSASDAKSALGTILDYTGYLSERDITPEYFGLFYKYRFASDPDTMKMFDFIVDSIHYEFVINWSNSLGKILSEVRTLAFSPLSPAGSGLSGLQTSTQTRLNSLYESIEKLKD